MIPSLNSKEITWQGHYFNDYCNWRDIQQFKDFVFNSPAAEIAGRFMESKYSVFYHEHVLNKEPGRMWPEFRSEYFQWLDNVTNVKSW